jgi:competence protein ComEC
MSDAMAVMLAVGVWLGAWGAWPVPRWPAIAGMVLFLAVRRPVPFTLAAAALAAGLAASAWSGLSPPVPGTVSGWATVIRTPQSVQGGVRAEVRLDGHHLDAWAHGAVASRLGAVAAGEEVELGGRVGPLGPVSRRALLPRHIAGRLEVSTVGRVRDGSPASQAAALVRRTLVRGARPLGDDDRSLLLGVILGDDTDRSPALEDRFRQSGLSHLLAVSGENVAFILVLVGPLLRRLRLSARWALTMVVLAFFGLLTGWEPSVIRAAVMAALACTATVTGRPASTVRLLALAVAASILVDPLLVHALGFQLSVGATTGIAVLSGSIAERLGRLPVLRARLLREIVSVTIAAQVGVLPVALPVFGGVPVASLPANVLAVPVAGPLTMWGLGAGLLAGRLGPPADRLLHLPTAAMAGWLDGVAGWGAGLPLGQVGPVQAAGIALVVLLVGSLRWSWRWVRTGSTSPRGRS